MGFWKALLLIHRHILISHLPLKQVEVCALKSTAIRSLSFVCGWIKKASRTYEVCSGAWNEWFIFFVLVFILQNWNASRFGSNPLNVSLPLYFFLILHIIKCLIYRCTKLWCRCFAILVIIYNQLKCLNKIFTYKKKHISPFLRRVIRLDIIITAIKRKLDL